MSLSQLAEAFDSEINSAEEATQNFSTKRTSIETPLFDIQFKQFELNGHVVDATKGLIPLDIFNFCDKLVIRLATDAITARSIVCGEEAVANDTAPSFQSLFDDSGSLKEEYSKKISDVQKKRAEILYTNIIAYLSTIQSFVACRDDMFPMAKQGIQFAWNTETKKPIFDIKEAIAYRIKTSATLRAVRNRVSARKSGADNLVALDFSLAHSALNF